VIGLRAHDDIDLGPPRDLSPLGLRHAAGDGNHRILTVLAQPPDIRIDFVGRPFADVAGVEHHQIGGIGIVGRG
jgi:hypothetical protein